MRRSSRVTRRRFLAAAAGSAAAAVAGAPYFVPARALGRDGAIAPSNRIATGHIGVGGRGSGLLNSFLGLSEVQSVAVADVDVRHRERAAGVIEKKYADQAAAGAFKGTQTYNDFRELIERSDVDALVMAVPDHWHAVLACAALRAGKDIYTEKPLSLTVPDGRAVVETANRFGRVVQVGSHERSRSNARYAAELVRSGYIGKLHTIHVNMPVDNHGPIPPQPVMPVPDGFDYNMWLGPAPWAPYTEKRCHFHFRYILDYSGGEMTDRGAHIIDLAQLGHGSDDTGPVEVWGDGWAPEDGLFNTFMKYKFGFRYADGVQVLGESVGPRGIKYVGDKGWIFVYIHGGNLEASDPRLLQIALKPDDVHLGRSPGHHQDFIECVKTRKRPFATAEIGHRTATMCHIANIAMLLKRKLQWDPAAERFINDDAANHMLDRPMREPWRV